ncbi:hypothetical protein H310_14041 [Aphanomyces invadans]|uniref:Uncharacterized protein n=1 Tax=Aphanomyces invadans TaxID=157072 RepID=A0A024TCP9_9STRA|nr:hypothetical protein H310_14041 [Aphanomyces invadans]ETV91361.1 hypothetical protein H310_14041 [Aphanomyces invadans]|eukprot:XP_008879989.1 hypothetical protein H310_14041 [Aphanomyces invadans]
MLPCCFAVVVVLCAAAIASAVDPTITLNSVATSPVYSSMSLCSRAAIQEAANDLFKNSAGPVGACAQSLDMLPRQFLALQRATATHCRLLVNNSACSAFNDAYNAAVRTISPVCLLSPTQPSSVARSYDEFVAEWCAPPPQPSSKMPSNATNSTRENATVPTITAPPPSTRSVVDINTLPPSKPAPSSVAPSRVLQLCVAVHVALVAVSTDC